MSFGPGFKLPDGKALGHGQKSDEPDLPGAMVDLCDSSHFRPVAVRHEADVPLAMPAQEPSAFRVFLEAPERRVETRPGDRVFQVELAVRGIIGVTLLEPDFI